MGPFWNRNRVVVAPMACKVFQFGCPYVHLLFINTIDDTVVTDFMCFQKDGIRMTLSCTTDYYVNFDLIGSCSGVSVCPEHILTNLCVIVEYVTHY